MRSLYVPFSLIVLLSSLGPSQAVVLHPWCWDGTANASGAPDCAYNSYQQCMADKHSAGDCVANPAISPLPRA
jgi:hypothetical protein